jgi:hypothetical protein
MSNNNRNYNYLDTIPSQQYTPPSYQSAQPQYPLQQQAQVMGPNGQMINITELDQSIARFEEIKPQTEFREIRTQLPIVLANYYKKYFAYLETIKQRRGQDEYLSGLRKILNKMNEYVSKTEKTIINLKKTLDYTEATLPIQQQYSINGIPQTQNTFVIPELQNVVEKDNNIEFVDIFGLKKQNIAHISPEYRNLILLVIQSFMGFLPIIPEPKLNICLKILDETIKGIEKDNFLNTEKKLFDTIEGNPAFQPLVKVDIYSKLFSIFENGNLNIKDIKTDKIDDKIVETTPNKSSSSSPYSSPYSSSYGYSSYNSYGGSPYQSFGSNQKRNFQQQQQQGKPQQSSQPQSKTTKIKKILKYEVPSTNTTNTEYELQSLLKKKGIDITIYSFLNEQIIEELKNISPKQNIENEQQKENSLNSTIITGGEYKNKKGRKTVQKSKSNTNTKIKELHGYGIIKLIKDDKRLRDTLKTGKIDDFVTKLQESFKTKQKAKIIELTTWYERDKKIAEKTEIVSQIKDLKEKIKTESNDNKKKEFKKELDNKEKELQTINFQLGIQGNLRYTKAQIQKVVQELNLYLKDMIERKYPKRILKCGEESFGTMTRTVLDFFTNMTDKITIRNEGTYDKLKKNDELKSIYFIQMYYMMYETYLDYYRTYTIEKISKSFTKNTLASDNQLKLRILNGLGVYSVIIYRKLKEVLDKIKEMLLMVSPDFGKAMDMLTKVQTLLNSGANEAKKEKLLKIKKDILNEIAKLTNNKKTNQKQNGRDKFDKFGNGRDKFDKFDKFGNGRDKFDKFENRKPFNKFGEKKKFERYKKQENNNVSL